MALLYQDSKAYESAFVACVNSRGSHFLERKVKKLPVTFCTSLNANTGVMPALPCGNMGA